ncbi:MAG: phosphoribosylglycinamide formyltransferase [Pseudomonadota bacterium]
MSISTKKRVAVLISGRGSNLGALIDAAKDEHYPAEIVLVISNRPGAKGLEIAQSAGIPTKVLDHRVFGKGQAAREAFDAALALSLTETDIDFICLAGFMRLLTREFVSTFSNQIINIHPSLLPAFKGLNVHQRMLDAGVKIAGCTVHFVSADMDSGPIIGQAALPVVADDTEATLAARTLTLEHQLYPACLAAICSGRAVLDDNEIVKFEANSAVRDDWLTSIKS